jgi:hypothetical protein
MNRFVRIAVLVAALAAVLPGPGRAADSADPLLGSWKLNLARSAFNGAPGPKGQLRIYQRSGDGEKLTSRGVSSEGKPTFVQYTARYDGKDYPMTGSSGGNRISLRRIDEFTSESTQKRDGKASVVTKRVVSADGKVLTVTANGTSATGGVIDATMVFDRL